MIEKPQVTIYTDGSCWGNPGPGGWAAIINENGRERSLSGVSDNTTNNRMELTAALQALKSLKHSSNIHLYTDSEYLKRGITEWMDDWKARSWKRKGGQLANLDLWQALDAEIDRHDVAWHWVKGHYGNFWNEKVDRLARRAIFRQNR
jgi:ribonuclease HI